MRKNPHFKPSSFPSTVIQYRNKESIDSNGFKTVSIVPIEVNLSDIDSLPIEAYPSLESQLKAGITPEFVNPVINSKHDFETDSSVEVNNLLEKHSELVKPQSISVNSQNNQPASEA